MGQTETTSAAQQAMSTLTAQWYNAVVEACRLDPTTFQLAQGFPPLSTTSEQLWSVLDVLPPRTLTHYWGTGVESFAETYREVIFALTPAAMAPFVTAMGDSYQAWNEYKRTAPAEASREGQLAMFKAWEERNMPTGQGQRAYELLAELVNDPVAVAQERWEQSRADGVHAYDKTVEDLLVELERPGGGATVEFSSAKEASDVSHAWAHGRVGGLLDFFTGEASAKWERITTAIAQAGVEIEARFEHVLTFTAHPLEQPQQSIPHRPWYDGGALGFAYQHREAEMWQERLTWEEAFGPEGELAYALGGLVIVNGLSATLRSAATFGAEMREEISAAAKAGCFPFFEADAQGGWRHLPSFGQEGRLTVTSSVPPGNPVVLGAIVAPIGQSLGGGS
jgi:hypothetical protein